MSDDIKKKWNTYDMKTKDEILNQLYVDMKISLKTLNKTVPLLLNVFNSETPPNIKKELDAKFLEKLRVILNEEIKKYENKIGELNNRLKEKIIPIPFGENYRKFDLFYQFPIYTKSSIGIGKHVKIELSRANIDHLNTEIPKKLRHTLEGDLILVFNAENKFCNANLFQTNTLIPHRSFHVSGDGNVCLGDLQNTQGWLSSIKLDPVVINQKITEIVEMLNTVDLVSAYDLHGLDETHGVITKWINENTKTNRCRNCNSSITTENYLCENCNYGIECCCECSTCDLCDERVREVCDNGHCDSCCTCESEDEE